MHEISPTSPVVVLGAPRSGTSLLAGWLHHSGILMGDRFLEADEGNPGGYFEDLEFLEFHRRLLTGSEAGTGRLLEDSSLRDEPFDCDLREEDRQAARALVNARVNAGKPWGWKDPRTCYYLDFWNELLPEAHYLLTYRHPLEMGASLLRMGRNWDCIFDPLLPLRSWTFSMKKVLRFVERLPEERFSIFALEAMREHPDPLASDLSRKLNISIDASALRQICRPPPDREPHRINQRQHAVFAEYFPEAAEAFDSLQEKSRFPAPLRKKLWGRDPILKLLKSGDVDPEVALRLLYDSIQPSLRQTHREAQQRTVDLAKDYIGQRFQSEEALRDSYNEQSDYLQERLSEVRELRERDRKLREEYRDLLEHSKKQKEHIAKLSEFFAKANGARKGEGR